MRHLLFSTFAYVKSPNTEKKLRELYAWHFKVSHSPNGTGYLEAYFSYNFQRIKFVFV
jgi:hypothetical protein